MLEEPGLGRTAPGGGLGVVSEFGGRALGCFFGDVFEGASADEAEMLEKLGGPGVNLGGGGGRGKLSAPENFVGHPVPDTGKGVLIEEKGLDGELRMTSENVAETSGSEGGVVRLWGQVFPRRVGTVFVKEDAAELSVIVEDERPVVLIKYEVVVLGGLMIWRAALESPRHAEMYFNQRSAYSQSACACRRCRDRGGVRGPDGRRRGEGEEDAFAVGPGGFKSLMEKGLAKLGGKGIAEDAGFGMERETSDLVIVAWSPLASAEFDFGEFGHKRGVPPGRAISVRKLARDECR
jgi:hypothetical protein